MKHILIIDEEPAITELEKDYLEINSFAVSVEHSGVTGLQRALKKDIDLVITEVAFSDCNGFELCKKLRDKRDIPIVVVSSKDDEVDKVRSLGMGADDYITKPFSPNEMIARVKAHLNCYKRLTRKYIEENDYINLPGLTIDKTARRIYVDGQEKIFTTKEFDLLTFLATHPNRVYSKDELFSEVWGMHSVGDIATVTVHIKKIRQKIEKNTAKPNYIETVWGSGYRFRIMGQEDEE